MSYGKKAAAQIVLLITGITMLCLSDIYVCEE